jgi:hypothetical protein
MDRVGRNGGGNALVQLVAGQRRVVSPRTSRPNRLVEQTVSASNSDSSKAFIVGASLVGGSLGAVSTGVIAALTHAPIVNWMGAGALVGAAGGALAEWSRQLCHSDGEKIVETYLDQYDVQSCEKKLLDTIANVHKTCQEKYSASTFQLLDERQVNDVRRYFRKNSEYNRFGLAFCVVSLGDGNAKVDLYIIRYPKTVAGEESRKNTNAVLGEYCKARSDTKISMGAFLACHYVPFFHVNPDFTNNQYGDYESPSLASQRSEGSEEFIVSNQLRKRAVSKKTGVVLTSVEPVRDASRKQSKINHKVFHGPTYLRQIEQKLPVACIKNLKRIEQDIECGRVSSKTINGFYIYDVNMGGDVGRGPWRLLVERINTDQAGNTYQFNEICDYHRDLPVLWAGVKRVV